MSDLRKAVSARDASELRRAAHCLKGAVDYFSKDSYQSVLRFEALAGDADWDGILQAWPSLEKELTLLMESVANLEPGG